MTRITPENVTDFPVGTALMFNFGAYRPDMYGEVTGFEILEETGNLPEEARLLAEYFDPIEEEIVQTTVNHFTEVGIGTYLIETPNPKHNPNSPWAS